MPYRARILPTFVSPNYTISPSLRPYPLKGKGKGKSKSKGPLNDASRKIIYLFNDVL
jgi:hypothetical protein